MKTTRTNSWTTPNTSAINSKDFSCLPGGYRTNLGTFSTIGGIDYWWRSTENYTNFPWGRFLDDNNGPVTRFRYGKTFGFSVRFLRD